MESEKNLIIMFWKIISLKVVQTNFDFECNACNSWQMSLHYLSNKVTKQMWLYDMI